MSFSVLRKVNSHVTMRPPVAASARFPRPRRRPVVMHATPAASPGPGVPEKRAMFLETAANRLADYARYEGKDSSTGQWAARFGVALQRYTASSAAWSAMPAPTDLPTLRAHERARREVAEHLDIVRRMKERVPDGLAPALGGFLEPDAEPGLAGEAGSAAGMWAGLSRAVEMSRLLFDITPVPNIVAAPLAPNSGCTCGGGGACTCGGTCGCGSNAHPSSKHGDLSVYNMDFSPALRPVPPAPPEADPAPPLDHLRKLMDYIDASVRLPDVAAWSTAVRAAMAEFETALSQWETHGPGYGGVNILKAASCCEHLLEEEKKLPAYPNVFMRGTFEDCQRWLDAWGAYTRGWKQRGSYMASPHARVQASLSERAKALRDEARPWGTTFT